MNDKNVNQFIVQDLKVRLDRYLVSQIPELSRSQIQKVIEAGLVMVNGVVQKESKFVVRKNNIVDYKQSEILNPKSEIQATNTPLKILYDNNGLLIIDKPAGLTVHPGAGFKGETLASALLYTFKDIKLVGEENRPGIVHRLDKDTSGVILVAKTQEMYEYLREAFAERKVKKEYIALVKGKVEKNFGKIDLPIGKSKTDFRKQEISYELTKTGRTTKHDVFEPKEALTEYKVLEYLELDSGQKGLDQYTLLLVKLHTGRTHQIRVHMKAIGHPLMGDSLYGGKGSQIPHLQRQFLHAKKIEVRLPDGSWIEAESELPKDLREVLVELDSKIINQL